MKNLFTTAMLWAIIGMPMLNAQTSVDTLHIVEQDITIAKIIASSIYEVRDVANWKLLIEKFRNQLEIVQDQIPDYEKYKIGFVKGQSLTVEDDFSSDEVLKYNILSDQVVPVPRISTAQLFDEDYEIRIYFTDLEKLLDRNYNILIESAFAKMKTYSKVGQKLRNAFLPENDIFYNNSTAEISKNKKARQVGIYIGSDATVGIYRNEPIVNINSELGFSFGDIESNILSLTYDLLFQYDTEFNRGVNQQLIGGVFMFSKNIGFGYSRPVDRDEDNFFDIKSRLKIIFSPVKGGKFILNFNKNFSDNYNVGFEYAVRLL